jgi:inner membrane protein
MLGRTHALIAVLAISSLAEPMVGDESSAPLLAFAALGALLPDLDSPRSLLTSWKVGKLAPFRPLALVISKTLGHRGPLHSLLGWAIFSSGAIIWSFHFTSGSLAGLSISVGYLSHLAADACTKTGIPALYPRPGRYHLLPRPLRFSTGSLAEEALFAILSVLFIGQLIASLLGQ